MHIVIVTDRFSPMIEHYYPDEHLFQDGSVPICWEENLTKWFNDNDRTVYHMKSLTVTKSQFTLNSTFYHKKTPIKGIYFGRK